MPLRTTKVKTSTYGKGILESVPAPLDPDSDPEFNPGIFTYETKKRGNRKATAAEDASPSAPRGKSRKRRSEVLGNFELSSRSRKRRPMDPEASRRHNPLKEYFDDDLGLQSASDDGEVDEDDPEDGDSAEEHESEPDQPVMLRTIAAFIKASKESTPIVTQKKADQVSTKRKSPASERIMPASKRRKTPCLDDESETEPESDIDLPTVSKLLAPNTVKLPESDSETEPEDEDETYPNPNLHAKPGFPLAPGQSPLGPMILDRAEGIMVPASINTYLREYQREGVRFFWELYKQGRGGLLGDDMGLVSPDVLFCSS
ncbi:hypothetical protein C8R48DRAFT_37945 [Suillus tomentosus]|nr:hypothetical protein C8R48DRAFT_37945 [Suillus tomentosus]